MFLEVLETLNDTLTNTTLNELSLFYPPLLIPELAATTILCLLLTMLASAAGIGGAALDSVVFISILNFIPKQVSPITKALVLGESFGGFLINMRRRHPLTKRPLIYYDVALAFEPSSLLGTTIGVYINQSFPSYIILAGLIIVLVFAIYRTIRRGILVYRSEKETNLDDLKREANQSNSISKGNTSNESPTSSEATSEVSSSEPLPDNVTVPIDNNKPEKKIDEELAHKLEKEKQFFNWKKFTFLFLTWLSLIIFNIIIGTKVVGIKCGTPLYWGLMSLLFPYIILLCFTIGYYLNRKYISRKEINYPYVKGDMKWTKKRVTLFTISSFITGLLAATFGLGGGTLNSPLLLELGLLPATVPSTSGLMILLTSSSALIQYLVLGISVWDYTIWYIAVGFIGGVTGHLFIRFYIKKYKKQSLIIFLLAMLIILGLISLTYSLASLFIDGKANLGFLNPCGK